MYSIKKYTVLPKIKEKENNLSGLQRLRAIDYWALAQRFERLVYSMVALPKGAF